MRRTTTVTLTILCMLLLAPALLEAAHGRGRNRQQWGHRNPGNVQLLNKASGTLASTSYEVVRRAEGHVGRFDRGERDAFDALVRLADQSRRFASATRGYRGRPEIVDREYAELVRAFVHAQRLFPRLDPDRGLDGAFYEFEAAIGRVDRRFFGNWAFGGIRPQEAGRRYSYGDDWYSQDDYARDEQWRREEERRARARGTRPPWAY